MKIILQITLAFIFISYIVNIEDEITIALRILNQATTKQSNKKILFAFSSDEDVQVQATNLLKELNCKESDLNQKNICGNILYHFHNGLGSELHIIEGFDRIVEISKKISTSQDLGGNAAQMALRAFKEGGEVYLSAIMSDKYYNNLYNQSIHIIPSEQLRNSIDDVHIVINFDKGDKFGSIECQQTNRLYLQNDRDNLQFSGLNKLDIEMKKIKPDAFVIGGFQLMNQKKRSEYEEIILKLEKLLQQYNHSIKIHFEMGAFTDQQLLTYLIEHVFPYIHSTGLNEQELLLLYNFIKTGKIINDKEQLSTNQQIYTVIELLDILKLERIHFHSQTIQMICSNNQWKDIQNALHRSVLVGLIQAMKSQNDNQFDLEYYNNTDLQFTIEEDKIELYHDDVIHVQTLKNSLLECWSVKQHKCCISPVLINQHPLRTCGLGDNIGATSLLYQLV